MIPARECVSGWTAFALLILVGCSGEPAAVPVADAESTEGVAVTEAAPAPEAAPSRAASGDYLPAAGEEGSLPRSLKGYALLDPAPADATNEAGFPFEGSVFAFKVLRKKPLEEVRAFSQDGEIFRIVYSDEDPPSFTDLASIARERYGKPFQDEENEIIWIQGGTTLTLSHLPKSNIVQIAIEDEKATLRAYQRGQNR